jgi:hypothetical protein
LEFKYYHPNKKKKEKENVSNFFQLQQRKTITLTSNYHRDQDHAIQTAALHKQTSEYVTLVTKPDTFIIIIWWESTYSLIKQSMWQHLKFYVGRRLRYKYSQTFFDVDGKGPV